MVGAGRLHVPVLELDFRVGGEWYTVMRSPDGNEYPAGYTFDQIVPPSASPTAAPCRMVQSGAAIPGHNIPQR
ncbi:SRPBCC domain-containing protein [Devosia sp. UYZn731]|uniref:SRPBCC family protein n=1 Tax=Devosia sp. UYZn731 TaxID=3156345 RepID=UPI003391CAC0